MLGVADVAVAGVLRHTLWSMWDVPTDRLLGRTSAWRHSVTRDGSKLLVRDGSVAIDVVVDEAVGVETISRSGTQLAWTRKQAASERTVWVDGEPHQVGPAVFTDDLTAVTTDGLVLRAALGPVRVADDNRLLVRSRYRQPYVRFSGSLPGAGELAAGWGVMEQHDVLW